MTETELTETELTEMVDLYVAGELPESLRALIESHLTAHPDSARDAETLRTTVAHLQAIPTERPDSWFVERLLDTLLREHAAEAPTPAFGYQP